MAPILPTEVQVDNLGEQQEMGREEEGESSHAGDQTSRGTGALETAEPSMREVLDVVKAMGTQMLAFSQAFTPLVNSSVGQVTPAQATRRAAQTAGTAAGVAPAAAHVAQTAARTVEDRAIVEADESWPSDLAAEQGREQAQPAGDSVKPAHSVFGSSLELIARWSVMVRAGVAGSWAVMGWWGLGLGQGTLDNVMGLIFGKPKGRKSILAVTPKKVQKGQFCRVLTENGTKFVRQSSAKLITERKKERDRRLEKRTVCGGVGLPVCSECGKARP
ncbi:hypothetical protein IGI04_019973 [Brassica rapa subsp. trilocularis]|uniref:Uncharacterized protein n=1 Tax=Brassica rapa subsp. trilocularis TaxID=1813537 RepID=A0ABQ7MKT6_BRACM|nr:hypothetical protein IGI04_019973 [Brassica rapa subsp. trilocularis]